MSSTPSLRVSDADLEYLLSPRSVRERARAVLARAEKGETHFRVNRAKLKPTTELVLDVTRRNYPDLSKIPFHARWEHFQVGGVDRLRALDQKLAGLTAPERARAKFDLVIVSVLLDAGAGNEWRYREGAAAYGRSEGLAVASLDMFLAGAFSADVKQPFRVDAAALKSLTSEKLAKGFQVSTQNPLVGLDGRAQLLRRLGEALEKRQEIFGRTGRPSGLLDWYKSQAKNGEVRAAQILKGVLLGLQDMWPARVQVNGVPFGDVWPLGTPDFAQLVPFHKLSQWLSYSLFAPVEDFGLKCSGAAELTGLPEYRNGGLLLDTGVLEFRDPAHGKSLHRPESALIIEWRALTVALLDEIGAEARRMLGMSEAELPLGKILQGGTWAAGRQTAAELRGGLPPLSIESDGTVF